MIRELTQEQIDQIPHYVEKWVNIHIDGKRDFMNPKRRFRVEKAIKKIYKTLESDKPKIIWCDSPIDEDYGLYSVAPNIKPLDGEYFYEKLWRPASKPVQLAASAGRGNLSPVSIEIGEPQ